MTPVAFYNENPRNEDPDQPINEFGEFDADGDLAVAEINFLTGLASAPATPQNNHTALAPNTLFDPEEGDFRVGSGAPMAGNIFNIARGLGVPIDDGVDAFGNPVDRLNRKINGRVTSIPSRRSPPARCRV